MLLLCERMMPQLCDFAQENGFDLSVYRDCLKRGWSFLEGNREPNGYAKWAEICIDQAPNTEEFQHHLTSAALDATLCIAGLMTFLTGHSIDHVIEAAGWARDTAFMHVEGTEITDPLPSGMEEINKHPLVQQELERQEEDLSLIERLPQTLTAGSITTPKERARRRSRILVLGNAGTDGTFTVS